MGAVCVLCVCCVWTVCGLCVGCVWAVCGLSGDCVWAVWTVTRGATAAHRSAVSPADGGAKPPRVTIFLLLLIILHI
jgi:hypothetical protein